MFITTIQNIYSEKDIKFNKTIPSQGIYLIYPVYKNFDYGFHV